MLRTTTVIVRALVAATVLLAGLAAANPQTSSGAGITVSAEPVRGAGDAELAFRIALDTHAGDLLVYDVAASATLLGLDGARIEGAFSWQPASESSHHRSGVLRFEALQPAAMSGSVLHLVLTDIGIPERRFEFEGRTLPRTQAVSAAGSRAMYLPVISDGAIVAIDTETFELAWTLTVSTGSETRPPESAMGIAVSLDGRTVYTGDAATRELVVVDAERREIVARVPLDHGIHAIDLAPDGRTLWVDGGLDGYPWLSATSIVDTGSLEAVQTLAPALGSAAHLAFTPDGREVWAPSVSSNLAWVWDASSGEVLAVIPLTSAPLAGSSPEAEQGLIGFNEIAIAPDGGVAYAVGPEAAVVYAIDVATRAVIGTAQAGARAHGIAVRPDGREVWTANRSGSVTIIDAATLSVLETLELGAYANHVAFTRDGQHALVSRETDVAVIDVAQRAVLWEIPVGNAPHEFSGEPPPASPRADATPGG